MSRFKDSYDALDSLVNCDMDGEDRKEAERIITESIDKVLLYNKLSEELGCPLEVVFKATTNGIIDFEGKEHTVVLGGYYLFVTENDELIRGIYLKNYQKTWWLKGDNNE